MGEILGGGRIGVHLKFNQWHQSRQIDMAIPYGFPVFKCFFLKAGYEMHINGLIQCMYLLWKEMFRLLCLR